MCDVPAANDTQKRGFTLIEMIIAVALFSMVMLIAVGSLVALIHSNRYARAESVAINNLQASVEVMAREIREGRAISIVSADHIQVERTDGTAVSFSLEDGQITRSVDAAAGQGLTAPDIDIATLSFTNVTNSDPPKVLIVVSGTVPVEGGRVAAVNVQTTSTQRYLPVLTGGQTVGSESSICTLASEPGRFIADLHDNTVPAVCPYDDRLISNGGYWCSTTYPEQYPDPNAKIILSESIEPGRYRVTLQAYDDHCPAGCSSTSCGCKDHTWCTAAQTQEQYVVEMYNASGVLIGTTPASDDIPLTANYNTTVVYSDGSPLILSEQVASIKVRHAATHPWDFCSASRPYNSVRPACVAFDWLGTGEIDAEIF